MNTKFLTDWRVIVSLFFFALIVTVAYVPFASLPYAGGGEVNSSLSYMGIDETERFPYGQHRVDDWDIDQSFDDFEWNTTTGSVILDTLLGYKDNTVPLDTVKKCGITVESGNPYYVKRVDGQYVKASENEIAKTYEKTYGNEVYKYNLMYFGLSVTIKTKSDVFYVDPAEFGYLNEFYPYGFHFENKKVDVSLRETFSIAPWKPVGVYNESYTITGGWAGIIDTEVYAVSFGQVDGDAEENYNHVIENLYSVGSTPNMYHISSDNPIATADFESTSELENIPSAIDVELGASLQAGAQYHLDALGHWDSIAVRNVFVNYKVVVKVAATIQMSFVTEGNELEDPEEDNTFYKPQIAVISDLEEGWNEFWADVAEYLNSPSGIIMMVAIIAVGGLIVYILIRLRFGR